MTRILVVDDDADIGRLVAEVLGDEGHQVRPLTRPQELAAAITSWQPDLVLLDVNLPYFDVWAALPLKSAPAALPLPVILMTGDRNAFNAVADLGALGVTGHLFKPFELTELLASVECACRLQSV